MNLVVVNLPDSEFPVLIPLAHITAVAVNPANQLAVLTVVNEERALITSMTAEELVKSMTRPHNSWATLEKYFPASTTVEV